MRDAFLARYNDELASLRASATEFALEHPRIAGRLRISEDAVEDPFVERLIESFAYLTARIRLKLDDDFPELSDALLGILYPHYQRPIPSLAIVQMEGQADMPEPHAIAAGTLLDTEDVDGERCRYRTAYPVAVHPIALRDASFMRRPFKAPQIKGAGDASACLHLVLEASAASPSIGHACPATLRVFLRGQSGYALYETLLNDAVAVGFDQGVTSRGPDCLRAVGFESHEGLLPYPETAHIGYRLLTEYFIFPEKFLFVDLELPDRRDLPAGRRLDVYILLRQTSAELERSVTADSFALNCTPIVNLFSQAAEPVSLAQTATEYRIVPDSRRTRALEVYAIDDAAILGDDGSRREALPFYAIQHATLDEAATGFAASTAWWLSRQTEVGGANPGGETFLELVDPLQQPARPADDVLAVNVTCLNRDLPQRLPFGGGHPYLTMLTPRPAIARIRALTAPTATLRPAFRRAGGWQLISHLALNHLSLAGPEGLSALREILLLYDVKGSAETRALIEALVGVQVRPGTARVRGGGGTAFCRGLDVEVTLDPTRFSGNGAFLMASVLERFLGLYVSVNSFTRLSASLLGRTGTLRTWAARSGDRVLL